MTYAVKYSMPEEKHLRFRTGSVMKIISIDNNVGKKIRLPQDTTAVTIFTFCKFVRSCGTSLTAFIDRICELTLIQLVKTCYSRSSRRRNLLYKLVYRHTRICEHLCRADKRLCEQLERRIGINVHALCVIYKALCKR